MTAKANMILRKMKLRRDQVLKEFSKSTLDDVGPFGGDTGEKVLTEFNEMEDLQFIAGRNET